MAGANDRTILESFSCYFDQCCGVFRKWSGFLSKLIWSLAERLNYWSSVYEILESSFCTFTNLYCDLITREDGIDSWRHRPSVFGRLLHKRPFVFTCRGVLTRNRCSRSLSGESNFEKVQIGQKEFDESSQGKLGSERRILWESHLGPTQSALPWNGDITLPDNTRKRVRERNLTETCALFWAVIRVRSLLFSEAVESSS